MTYDHDVMEKSYLDFLRTKKFYPIVVGLGVACVHLVITFALNFSPKAKITDPLAPIALILITPSMILQFIFLSLKIDLFPSSSLLPFPPSMFLFSSFFYGIIGSLLASKRKILQSIAIVSIVLLALSGCLITGLWVGLSTW